jgi:hypothetical protein
MSHVLVYELSLDLGPSRRKQVVVVAVVVVVRSEVKPKKPSWSRAYITKRNCVLKCRNLFFVDIEVESNNAMSVFTTRLGDWNGIDRVDECISKRSDLMGSSWISIHVEKRTTGTNFVWSIIRTLWNSTRKENEQLFPYCLHIK